LDAVHSYAAREYEEEEEGPCDLLLVAGEEYWSVAEVAAAASALLRPDGQGALLLLPARNPDDLVVVEDGNETYHGVLTALGWKAAPESGLELTAASAAATERPRAYLTPQSSPEPLTTPNLPPTAFVTVACDGNSEADPPPTSRLVRSLVGSLVAALQADEDDSKATKNNPFGQQKEVRPPVPQKEKSVVKLVVFADATALPWLQAQLLPLEAITHLEGWRGNRLDLDVRSLVLPPGWELLGDNLLCSASRLHLPDLLPDVARAVWLDADTLFARRDAPWKLLEAAEASASPLVPPPSPSSSPPPSPDAPHAPHTPPPAVLAKGVLEHGCKSRARWYASDRALNAGVLALDLKELRAVDWLRRVEAAYAANRRGMMFGDQDLLNDALREGETKLLPCEFNWRPDVCFYDAFDCDRFEILRGHHLFEL
jgi:hypothetical protein